MAKKVFFYASLLFNVALLVLLWAFVQRLGGWHYARHRFEQDESGLYLHRKQLFEQMPPQPGAIVFAGDSQVEQCEWAELLPASGSPVLNRGISGDQTYGLLHRLNEVLRHRPTRIYVEIGINDLLLRVPEAEAMGRYAAIVERIRKVCPDSDVFLCSLLPVNNDMKYVGVDANAIQAFNAKVAQLANQYALPYLDFYTPLLDTEGRLSARYTDDGVHINGAGYGQLKKLVIASIRDDQ
jgi:lysophospholipase L1-like esterase